jgi:DNA-3-methyladenine glycosylase II
VESSTVTLRPRQPYDFNLTAGYHTYFRGVYGADRFEDGVYRRLLHVGGQPILASARSNGDELEVEIQGETVTPHVAAEVADKVGWLLGCDVDMEGFYLMASTDTVLDKAVRRLYGLHPPHTLTVFEAVVMAIVGQQIASNIAAIIRGLLVDRLGPSFEVDGNTYRAFPGADSFLTAGMKGLREMKLSERKAEYILDIAYRVSTGALDLEGLHALTDDQISQRLLALRGIGPWTVNWVSLRALGRENAFPIGDLALRRVMSTLYFGGRETDASALENFSRRWSPYRSFVTLYLFAAARMGVLPGLGGSTEVGP